ncbi:MAG: hypothetical protein JWR74_3187 [Polaromonas sp.]|nr:hypothetical protein [Polaromonas sp.]
MRDFDPTASEFISSGFLARSRPGGVLYDPMTILSVGGSLVGGMMASDAAGDAADAQEAAAARSDATQRYQYDTTRADNAPMRETGVAANNRLAYLMGLGGSASGGGALTREQMRTNLLSQYTTAGAGGPVYQDEGSNPNEPTGGWANGIRIPTGYTQGASTVDEAGLTAAIEKQWGAQQAAQTAQSNDPAYGSLTRKFGASDLAGDAVYQSGLQFGLDEGTKGINRQAAAGGSMLSGATLKALTRFGNDYGSTKANESYNRFNTDQNSQYNKLAGLSGAGQQATNSVTAAGTNMANNISQSQQGVGNARGSAYLAQGNSWQNALNGGVSALKNYGGSGFGGNTGFQTGSGTMNELSSYGVF